MNEIIKNMTATANSSSVENLKTNSGTGAPNQFIITQEDYYIFKSYSSIIAVYDRINHILVLGKDWDYSKTTMRYTKQFIEDYTDFFYNSAKEFRESIESCDNIIYNGDLR